MRITFLFEIRIERPQRSEASEPDEPQFEHRDNDGTLVGSTGPFYRDDGYYQGVPDIQAGFQPNPKTTGT